MKYIIPILLFAFIVTSVRGQGFIYSTPFSFSTGSNAPGNQITVGHIYKAESITLSAAMKLSSINDKELRRNKTTSMILGVGFPVGDVSIMAVIGPEYYKSNFGLVGGGQLIHLLKINNNLRSVVTAELTTSKFYKSNFSVSMGLAWKLSE